ncbi:hypothetical protein [Methylobacterium sp. Leaf456]|uniref:hypothetical protein n=1 Tax=Methylobacterium sp. Leaf456 TaxID=1736382 RepID=UPI0012E3E006|nr:hypothetical protein [Methylobacterium sp. Leaf456]
MFDQRDYRLAFMTWTLGFATGVDNVRIVRDRQFRDLSSLNVDLVVGSLWAISAQYPTAFLLQGQSAFLESPPLRAWPRPR